LRGSEAEASDIDFDGFVTCHHSHGTKTVRRYR